MSTPTVSWEEVTPDRAARWLAHNIENNRRINEGTVLQYALDMREGRWNQDNAQPIQFDTEMRLLDGQHRLTAVARSGKTLRMLVVRGVPTETVSVMDAGRKRSYADALHMRGYANANRIAATIRLAFLWDAKYRGMQLFRPPVPPTVSELIAYGDNHPEVEHCTRAAIGTYKVVRGCEGRIYAFAYWLFAKSDASKVAEFYAQLHSGQFTVAGSPIYLLRDQLLRDNLSREKRPQHVSLAYFIKAWNAYCDGTPIKLLRFREDEEFPEPK